MRHRYDANVATAATAEELRAGFGATMAATLRDDATLHRLWYDLRNQSQFEERFRADVADIDRSLERMIWRIVTRYAELSGRDVAVTPAFAYALLDGVFQHALLAPPGRRPRRRPGARRAASVRSCRRSFARRLR